MNCFLKQLQIYVRSLLRSKEKSQELRTMFTLFVSCIDLPRLSSQSGYDMLTELLCTLKVLPRYIASTCNFLTLVKLLLIIVLLSQIFLN